MASLGEAFVPSPLRRNFLVAVGAAVVLAGCRSVDGDSEAIRKHLPSTGSTDRTALPPPVAEGPSTPAASAERPAVPSAPAASPPLDREQIMRTFAGVKPQAWGLEPPGVALSLPAGTTAVALTFDCCGGPGGSGFDHTLLSALISHDVPATFFLNARWVRSNPELTRELAANPLFEVASHGSAHLPLSVTGRQAYGLPGTTDAGMVYDEIMGAQAELSAVTGTAPRFFRSGTAHYDDVAAQICRALGVVPVNFNVNGDGGATYTAAAVSTEILSAHPGSIIIAHANQPASGTGAGVAAALPHMVGRGTTFIRLCDSPPL